MGEVIVITSGKGGVGKTTTVANIGTGLAMMGKKTVVVDTDIGLRNLDVVLGLENRIVYNLVDVVHGSCRLKQALIRDKRHPELYLLPSAQTKDKTAVSPEQMIKLTDDLREEFDYILLDCPAGIEQGFKNAIAGADKALVVTTPEVSAIRDADRIIGLLDVFSEPAIGCPPIKFFSSPSSSTALWILPLTLPTSVIMQSSFIISLRIFKYSTFFSTGVHKKI